VPIEDARGLWVAKDPLLRTVLASGGVPLTAADLNTGAAVGWRDGEDPDTVATRIRDQVAGVNVQIPSELSRQLRSSTAFFSSLLVGMAALGLVIGGLSLANTVTAALFERIRDFGVKRALGATDGAGPWLIDGAADPSGAAVEAAWLAPGAVVDPGGYVQVGAPATGAHAATPAATRPPPAARRRARRLSARAVGSESDVAGTGWGRAPSTRRVLLSIPR